MSLQLVVKLGKRGKGFINPFIYIIKEVVLVSIMLHHLRFLFELKVTIAKDNCGVVPFICNCSVCYNKCIANCDTIFSTSKSIRGYFY